MTCVKKSQQKLNLKVVLKMSEKKLAVSMDDVGADNIPEPTGEVAELLKGITSKQKQPDKTQISVYLEPKVAKAFNSFGKKHGKGSKSELINNFLKQALEIE